jgi:hypothetical protein
VAVLHCYFATMRQGSLGPAPTTPTQGAVPASAPLPSARGAYATSERRINLDGQAFPHAFIQNIAGVGSSSAVQRIAHEIHGPYGVWLRNHDQRMATSNRQPIFSPTWQVQVKQAAHEPQLLMIPAMPVEVEAITTFPQAPATLHAHERCKCGQYLRITPRQIRKLP